MTRSMFASMRTVRSFCRVCTSVCGILVDVDGDEVVAVHGDRDHPFSHGYTCPKGRALPRCTTTRTASSIRCMRVDGELRADHMGGLPRRSRRPGCARHRRARTRAVGIFFGTGVGMDAAGYRMAQALHAAIGTPAKFSPLTIDGTAKVLISDLVGGRWR